MEKIYEEIFNYIIKYDKISENQFKYLEIKYGISTIIAFFEYYLYDKDITEETKTYLKIIREQYENNGEVFDDNLKIYLKEVAEYGILTKEEEKYHLTIIEKYRNLIKNISYETLTKDLNKIPELSNITLDEYNIDKYLELFQSFKSIKEEEKQKLINKITIFKLYQESFNTIINHNLRFVIYYAKRYIGNGLDLLDLIQEGNDGLIIAANKYRNECNTRFTTYASFWINSKILKAIKTKGNAIHVSTHVYDREKLYKIATQTLEKKA